MIVQTVCLLLDVDASVCSTPVSKGGIKTNKHVYYPHFVDNQRIL